MRIHKKKKLEAKWKELSRLLIRSTLKAKARTILSDCYNSWTKISDRFEKIASS